MNGVKGGFNPGAVLTSARCRAIGRLNWGVCNWEVKYGDPDSGGLSLEVGGGAYKRAQGVSELLQDPAYSLSITGTEFLKDREYLEIHQLAHSWRFL